jgi:predicted metal-dependent peptidase
MRQLDGTADPAAEVREIEGESPQEAKPQQGTKETAADDDSQKEKNPSFLHNGEQQEQLENKWKEISERMLVDLETSSREWGDKSDSMVQSLKKINRDKYDYRTFLQKFSTIKEDIQLNDEEFDYVYYIYGLNHYGNMPLIEPLEYKEARKIHDFVIAIDTSGSCAGEVVQKFLDKTYSIFSQQENFFRKINLHIIQCDATIQEDAKITSQDEFDEYLKAMKIRGLGGTDFRPVFSYVDWLREKKEFQNLKGLIYFTDGWGTFPAKKPDYDAAFVFIDDGMNNYDVPPWAIKLVLQKKEI